MSRYNTIPAFIKSVISFRMSQSVCTVCEFTEYIHKYKAYSALLLYTIYENE